MGRPVILSDIDQNFVAAIPDEIEILLGNDFTRKYKAEIFCKTQSAKFEIQGSTIEIPRI